MRPARERLDAEVDEPVTRILLNPRWLIPAAALLAGLGGTAAGAQSPTSSLHDSPRVQAALTGLYGGASPVLLWSEAGRPTRQASEAVALLGEARSRGLRPGDYQASGRQAGLAALAAGSGDAALAAAFDTALSRSVLRLLDHLHAGRVVPREIGLDIPGAHDSLDLAGLLLGVSRSDDVRTAVSMAEPRYAGYVALRGMLTRYLELETDTTLRAPARPSATLRPGDRYSDAAALRRLLEAFGDLPPGTEPAHDSAGVEIYAGPLVDAVAAFQRRHGLEADGLAGPATFAQLRVRIAQRVRQIELTLERWRWLPDRPPPRYLVVNAPAFRLAMFEDDSLASRPSLTMKVIVGATEGRHYTPVFSGVMTEVVFRPFWDVPLSIARKELLPLVRRDPGYLRREGFEIVRGGDDDATVFAPTEGNLSRVAANTLRLRQRPGRSNALGLAKFIFPNRYSVFMHGTPATQLFSLARRDFSHGCIRVEDPARLAEQVLRLQPEWTRAAIDSAMNGSRTRRVRVAAPVAVYVLYATAVVDETGRQMFIADIYGHDARLARALGI